jgi:hypothetical protein
MASQSPGLPPLPCQGAILVSEPYLQSQRILVFVAVFRGRRKPRFVLLWCRAMSHG